MTPGNTRARPAAPSLARATGSLAIATLTSRITGFGWKVVLAWVVGFSVVNDSFTIASNFPTIINELLIGGVLTSVVVPLLVRSQKEDADGGEAYTQRLLTVGLAVLTAGTVVAIACAPLLTAVYTTEATSNTALTTAFTYLMLPAIVFLGMSAMLMAVLNARQRFTAAGWAPVLNNVVMFLMIGLYAVLPGEISLDPVRMGEAKLLVLGIGLPLGLASQLLVLVPALRRTGFRFRARWGWDRRLAEFGGLAAWVVGYTLLGQVGLSAITNAATAGAPGGPAIYATTWLL
ncbi:MAG TPA: lipid II flippase MurJ, partial [Micromonosporaceae bacterium]|nr:lipid II flippase MurJ [Micromonosporaceae bacterium]